MKTMSLVKTFLELKASISSKTYRLLAVSYTHLDVYKRQIYISVMTIISSVRQLVETPIDAMNEGSSPILSYNYGAHRPKRVKHAIGTMAVMIFVYTRCV